MIINSTFMAFDSTEVRYYRAFVNVNDYVDISHYFRTFGHCVDKCL